MYGTHYKTDGTSTKVEPTNGKSFSLAELQKYVGGTIDVQVLPDGTVIYLNDNGKLDGLPKNEYATTLWIVAYPIAQYPENNDELIVGDVFILDAENDLLQNKEDEEEI